MAHTWQLQEAKSRFSEVIDDALNDGPQVITRRGVETAVVIGIKEYRQLLLGRKKLSEFFRESPLVDVDIDLTRDKSPGRKDIEL